MKRSYLKTKETVSIANLKAKLAFYLRKVRAGEEVIITEHRQPIARLVQLEPTEGLEIIRASGAFADVANKLFAPLEGQAEIRSLSYLLTERGNR